MRKSRRYLPTGLAVLAVAMPSLAEERFLLAAENQVIEINRAGRVTSILKHPGHGNIWEAWRLPDGGIFYVHRDGMAVFDKNNRLVMELAARCSMAVSGSPCSIARQPRSAWSIGAAPWSAELRFQICGRSRYIPATA